MTTTPTTLIFVSFSTTLSNAFIGGRISGITDTVKEELLARIKNQHKTNRQALAGAERIANNTKALTSSCPTANLIVIEAKNMN